MSNMEVPTRKLSDFNTEYIKCKTECKTKCSLHLVLPLVLCSMFLPKARGREFLTPGLMEEYGVQDQVQDQVQLALGVALGRVPNFLQIQSIGWLRFIGFEEIWCRTNRRTKCNLTLVLHLVLRLVLRPCASMRMAEGMAGWKQYGSSTSLLNYMLLLLYWCIEMLHRCELLEK